MGSDGRPALPPPTPTPSSSPIYPPPSPLTIPLPLTTTTTHKSPKGRRNVTPMSGQGRPPPSSPLLHQGHPQSAQCRRPKVAPILSPLHPQVQQCRRSDGTPRAVFWRDSKKRNTWGHFWPKTTPERPFLLPEASLTRGPSSGQGRTAQGPVSGQGRAATLAILWPRANSLRTSFWPRANYYTGYHMANGDIALRPSSCRSRPTLLSHGPPWPAIARHGLAKAGIWPALFGSNMGGFGVMQHPRGTLGATLGRPWVDLGSPNVRPKVAPREVPVPIPAMAGHG